MKVPFVHFHPTLVPYIRAYLADDQSLISNLQERYWRVYYAFANDLYQTDTQQPYIARALAARELPNLKRALKLTLAADALDEAVGFADSINRFLDYFGRWRERDEVAALVEKTVNSNQSSVGSGKMTQREFLLESGRGERLLQQGRAAEAEKVFRALLSRLEGQVEYDTRYDQTTTLSRLGRSLVEQGRPSQAIDFYNHSITLAKTLEQNNDVKKQMGLCHTRIADVLAAIGQYENARQEYESALEIDRELGDERGQGVDLGQLGTLAMTQGDLNDARKRYLEALSLFQHMGEDQMSAMAWLNLGIIADKNSDFDEAEKYYKEAMSLYEKIGDYSYMAATSHNLAVSSEHAGRPQEAERWYLRAIEMFEKIGDKQSPAKCYSNLAGMYLSQNRLDEAETYARRALAIMETLDLSSEPWKTYGILAQTAEKRGKVDDVRAWRRKEQESFAAFAGSDTQIKQFEPLIAAIVAACQGNEEALAQVEPVLQSMENGDDINRAFAISTRKLFAGERDGNVLLDGLSREPFLVMKRVLQALAEGTVDGRQQTVESGPSSTVHGQAQPQQQQGVTLPQLLELVERAAGGDQQLGGQLFNAFQQMARSGDAFQSALGNVLLRVLVGDKNPDLSQLPDEVASAVRGLLGRLKNK